MMTATFSQNFGKLFPIPELVTDNLPLFTLRPTEKPLQIIIIKPFLIHVDSCSTGNHFPYISHC